MNFFIIYVKHDGGDRFYMVSDGIVWKGITLTKRVIDGLTYYNTGNRRGNVEYDKKFVKVALVSCVGVENVKNGQINPLRVSFIKGKI